MESLVLENNLIKHYSPVTTARTWNTYYPTSLTGERFPAAAIKQRYNRQFEMSGEKRRNQRLG